MQETPPAGGDTLWASGYEIYDRGMCHIPNKLDLAPDSCSIPTNAEVPGELDRRMRTAGLQISM